MELKRRIQPTRPEDGYGLLVCQRPGERCLSDFGIAQAMREAIDLGLFCEESDRSSSRKQAEENKQPDQKSAKLKL